MLSPVLSTLALLVLIATAVEGAERYPTGSANVWEFVDCVRNSDGYQTAEAWQWLTGNAPTETGAPNWKYKVVEGGSYYWEGKSTSFYESGNLHQAYIFDGVSTNQDGPLGIQATNEATGSWAWYGSGWAPRGVGGGWTCNAVYWSMELPHVTLQTTFSGTQKICEYSGAYSDIANAVGLTSSLQNGQYTFDNTGLYAQNSCCDITTPCCSCSPCGGEIGSSVNVGTSNAQGEVQVMLNMLETVGSKKTGDAQCVCQNNLNGDCEDNPDGTYTPQLGRVDLTYGPFTDSTGRYPVNPTGDAAYIQYGLSEQPPSQCSGAILDTFLSIIEAAAVGLLTGGAGDGVAIAQVVANADGSLAVFGIECALG